MYISKLELENFRGIKKLSIELDEHINVFVGMNGSGKSTLLDASAMMLSWLINRIKQSGSSGRPITEQDIRNGEAFSKVDLTLNIDSDDVMWSQVKTRRGRSHSGKSDFKQLSELAKRTQQDMEEKKQGNLSLLAYYPVNRAVLDIPLRIRQRHSFDLLSAFDDSLTSGANFGTFFKWFREREDLENEQRSDNLQPHDAQLNAVRVALNQFMPDFTDLRVRRNPLRMEVKKAGEMLTVDQLSDGEKTLMSMVGDLARRMAIANPDREDPLQGDGIVMIDEVDLHLHPKWQRMMVARLRAAFPNIQFLLSTHSPHVLNHVSANNIHLMSSSPEGISVVKPTESYGRNVDRILEDLMGLETTRPDAIEAALSSVFSAISQGDLEQAGKEIEALAEEIGEDPELVKARVLVKRKELIGK